MTTIAVLNLQSSNHYSRDLLLANCCSGPHRYDRESAQLLTRPGVAAGLAWTQTGGEILYVEASRMRSGSDGGVGKGHMTLTGQLGDVMKESAQLAVSWLRSNAKSLGISDGGKFG